MAALGTIATTQKQLKCAGQTDGYRKDGAHIHTKYSVWFRKVLIMLFLFLLVTTPAPCHISHLLLMKALSLLTLTAFHFVSAI